MPQPICHSDASFCAAGVSDFWILDSVSRFVLSQAAEAAAANETRQQRRLQRHRERLKELRDEAAAKEKGLPWPPPNAAPKPARNGALPATQCHRHRL